MTKYTSFAEFVKSADHDSQQVLQQWLHHFNFDINWLKLGTLNVTVLTITSGHDVLQTYSVCCEQTNKLSWRNRKENPHDHVKMLNIPMLITEGCATNVNGGHSWYRVSVWQIKQQKDMHLEVNSCQRLQSQLGQILGWA